MSASATSNLPDPGPRRHVAVLGDRVLVAPPDGGERQSKDGILIPATARSVGLHR